MEIGISEAARKYGISGATIRFWIKTKKLPADKKKIGNSKVPQYRLKEAALEKLLKDQGYTQPKAAEPVASPIGRKVFDFVQKHPEKFESITLRELNDWIRELES
jgi:DNA-binding transcriptional MerR regulator